MSASGVGQRLTGEALVGAKVTVWWDGDGQWFSGTVAKYCSEEGHKNSLKHWIKYEDGEKKWHQLDNPLEVRAPTPPPVAYDPAIPISLTASPLCFGRNGRCRRHRLRTALLVLGLSACAVLWAASLRTCTPECI